jgi:serine/threonine protein kinase
MVADGGRRLGFIHRIPLETGGETVALSMELLRGETLSRRISRGALKWQEALPIIRQLVTGLEAAHEAGILHRDLKSGNVILVSREGGPPTAVITDFGAHIDKYDRSRSPAGPAGSRHADAGDSRWWRALCRPGGQPVSIRRRWRCGKNEFTECGARSQRAGDRLACYCA